MPLIYRVENARGNGPYWAGIVPGDVNIYPPAGDDSSRHPTVCEDRGFHGKGVSNVAHDLNVSMRDCRFGFPTMDMFNAWFYSTEWLQELVNAGFQLAVYEVPEDRMMSGYTQAMFVLADATLVERRPLLQ